MTQTNYLQTIYNTQKSFYKKAYYTREEQEDFIIYKLYSYNTLVITLKVNVNDISKSYYILQPNVEITNTTLKHIKEFLHQQMTRKMNAYDILQYKKMTKSNIIRFTRYNKSLQEFLKSEEEEKKERKRKKDEEKNK